MGIQGLNIGLSALRTSQAAMETIGHNLSNANTPGYSRQDVHLGAARARMSAGLQIGMGVQLDGITRTSDSILNRRIVTQSAQVARLESLFGGMSSVESMLGEPGGFGLGGLVDGFFESLASLSAAPGDSIFQSAVTRSGQSLSTEFQQLTDGFEQSRDDAFGRVELMVQEVNELARQLRNYNLEIGQLEGQGLDSNDLRDQRDETMRALAQRVDVTYHEQGGAFRVLVGNQTLVSPTTASQLQVVRDANAGISLQFTGGEPVEVEVVGGEIGGLLAFANEFIPTLQSEIDTLAQNMIFEMNRIHSTGVPSSGGYTELIGAFALEDVASGASPSNLLLADAGLPFDIQEGRLHVSVVNRSTGATEMTVIEVDPATTSVQAFLDDLNSVARISANIDSSGRLGIRASAGYSFHFGAQIPEHPDTSEAFGSGRASLGTGTGAPFGLAHGDTLDIAGQIGPFTVTFDAADFANIDTASAQEVAAVLNADPTLAASGMRAEVVGDQVFLQTEGTGSAQTFDVTGGSALGALGLAATTVTGRDVAVNTTIGGAYTGTGNGSFTFRPVGDGMIGTTPDLQVEVVDGAGLVVATLNVGEGYEPGTELALPDGLTVSFSFGEVSSANNDAFVLDLIADSDTSDVLAALGLGAMFAGHDAATIEMRQDLIEDPSLIAASSTGAAGDSGTLLDLLSLQQESVTGLGGSFSEYYASTVGRVGFEVSSTRGAAEVEQFLADSLTSRREQVSGVNVDEELVNLIQFEQAFTAASRFIQTVNNVTDELMNLI